MKTSISFLQILGILFIALKLTGHIDWSWWWVLTPFWITLAGVIALVLGYLLVELIYQLQYLIIVSRFNKRK